MEFKKFENLLKEASNIVEKIPIKEKTFMDISGYPYYENVCSNILAFYFKPKEEHKLKPKYERIVNIFFDEQPFIGIYRGRTNIVKNQNLAGEIKGNNYFSYYGLENWYRI